MKTNQFNVGDRISVSGVVISFRDGMSFLECDGAYFLVDRVFDKNHLIVKNKHTSELFRAHYKQCRRIKKKERRRIWVKYDFPLIRNGSCIIAYHSEPPDGYIEFIEVRKK